MEEIKRRRGRRKALVKTATKDRRQISILVENPTLDAAQVVIAKAGMTISGIVRRLLAKIGTEGKMPDL